MSILGLVVDVRAGSGSCFTEIKKSRLPDTSDAWQPHPSCKHRTVAFDTAKLDSVIVGEIELGKFNYLTAKVDLMSRLPVSGARIATPLRRKTALRDVLIGLCPGGKFSKADVARFHDRLSFIIGQWSAENDRLEISPLARTLAAMSKELARVSRVLSGRETGFRDSRDTAIVSKLAAILAEDPEVGSLQQADKLIASFRFEATRIAHACTVAARDLQSHPGNSGRPPLEWYNEFCHLLLEIAQTGGVKPRFEKDRITGARRGWLIEAARALETFLPPQMRSPDDESRGKRLEKAKKNLKSKIGKTFHLTERFCRCDKPWKRP